MSTDPVVASNSGSEAATIVIPASPVIEYVPRELVKPLAVGDNI